MGKTVSRILTTARSLQSPRMRVTCIVLTVLAALLGLVVCQVRVPFPVPFYYPVYVPGKEDKFDGGSDVLLGGTGALVGLFVIAMIMMASTSSTSIFTPNTPSVTPMSATPPFGGGGK